MVLYYTRVGIYECWNLKENLKGRSSEQVKEVNENHKRRVENKNRTHCTWFSKLFDYISQSEDQNDDQRTENEERGKIFHIFGVIEWDTCMQHGCPSTLVISLHCSIFFYGHWHFSFVIHFQPVRSLVLLFFFTY